MSYSANQYNYATPLSSSSGFFGEAIVDDKKYFTLSDNALDGSYFPIVGDVGLWGSSLPTSDGTLAEPFIVTVIEELTINTFKLVSSSYSFPVDFTVAFYNGDTLLHTVSETGNSKYEYIYYLEETLSVTRYVISITKVSNPNSPVRLYNTHNVDYVRRTDNLKVASVDISAVSTLLALKSFDYALIKQDNTSSILNSISAKDSVYTKEASNDAITNSIEASDTLSNVSNSDTTIANEILIIRDTLNLKSTERSSIVNRIDVSKDTLKGKILEGTSNVRNTIDVSKDTFKVRTDLAHELTNIHSVMKKPFRQVYGKVLITYTDPMLDEETMITSTPGAYNSVLTQVLDGVEEPTYNYFTLYDNDLTGAYVVNDLNSQVGWVSSEISDANGVFSNPPSVTVSFSARPIVSFMITFDDNRDNIVKDFSVTFKKEDGTSIVRNYVDNTEVSVPIVTEGVADVVAITVTIYKINRPNSPAVIVDMPVSSTVTYNGLADVSNLISIDLLEELTYDDDVEALGGVSANEITVVLDNSNKAFMFNAQSLVSRQLRRNRKIVPYLGAEVIPGQIEWHVLGTFWSYRWDVPINGLTASVVGFDTIGLISTTDYKEHHVQVNKSIGQLVEYILDDIKQTLSFIEYDIDPSLYDIIIPYAWFDHSSHAAALRKLSLCYPMHIYCDRNGIICVKPQKLRLDYYYDTWTKDTNLIDTSYSSLYATLPNIINVTTVVPVVKENEQLVQDTTVFNVQGEATKRLNFSAPYLSNPVVTIDCDTSVNYTYKAYSWGTEIDFIGQGVVRYITCTGSCINTENKTVVLWQDSESVRLNGAVTRDIQSDLIQTNEHANLIINRIASLSVNDKYDATVEYRGDISLTINDPILLNDGIAPDNRYNIKRHQLSWNGSLTGSADLNT